MKDDHLAGPNKFLTCVLEEPDSNLNSPEIFNDFPWRKLHNEELHNLYSLPNIIRMMKSRKIRCVDHVARMGKKGNTYWVLVGKLERNRPLGRPRRRWEDNIKMDLR
jgi:hypothetical protein